MTGYFRNGRCDTCAQDTGCHTVCVEVSAAFLAASRERGNDLSTPRLEYDFPGLVPGDRWCVCATRWLELIEAGVAAPIVPGATHERTLELIPLALLQQQQTHGVHHPWPAQLNQQHTMPHPHGVPPQLQQRQ